MHAIVDGIVEMLKQDGVFISESHYLIALLDALQYDTIYHEHLRYYSLTQKLASMVTDSRHARSRRLNQSSTTAR